MAWPHEELDVAQPRRLLHFALRFPVSPTCLGTLMLVAFEGWPIADVDSKARELRLHGGALLIKPEQETSAPHTK